MQTMCGGRWAGKGKATQNPSKPTAGIKQLLVPQNPEPPDNIKSLVHGGVLDTDGTICLCANVTS